MTTVAVAGAAGRMGRLVAASVAADPELSWVPAMTPGFPVKRSPVCR